MLSAGISRTQKLQVRNLFSIRFLKPNYVAGSTADEGEEACRLDSSSPSGSIRSLLDAV